MNKNICKEGCKNSFKGSLKCDIIGTVDELVSFLGIVRWEISNSNIKIIEDIQKDLFIFNGALATENIKVNLEMLSKLTNYCNDLKINLKLPNNFVIPGNKTKSGAYVDFARTLARKCERKIVRLSKKDLKNEILLKWINLLSYCLWLLARKEESNVE